MSLEAVDLFHIGFNIAHGGNESKVDTKIHWIHGYLQVVGYFFPPKQTTVSTWDEKTILMLPALVRSREQID